MVPIGLLFQITKKENMKKILLLIIVVAPLLGRSQSYEDSILTVKLPQRFSFYLGYWLKATLSIDNRDMPNQIIPYFGKNEKPDSLFTVSIKAKMLQGGLMYLMAGSSAATGDDYFKTVKNYPAIANYTSLETQIVQKANNEKDAERNTAKWLLDWFVEKRKDAKQFYDNEKQLMTKW